MNNHQLINPHGLPVPSRTSPSRDHHPGNAFEYVPADVWTSTNCRVVAIDGDYFSKSHFHTLKEYRNWAGLMNGDVEVLGRVLLDSLFLDLVVVTPQGHLRASSICLHEIKALHPDIQEFLTLQLEAPPILTRENPWSKFTKNKRSTK
ncbi:hypothetical protein [Arthrobacter sp. H35-D1]|uniref:hypothetical protein n=1 Tax=Arthrobacter sp. H35-D1 TaxID=3046202 RepID=UPI0024BA6CB6|nr:hypothetical protein [Arthrobacter sp. H35-D1]MDJ0315068.1 hypothetical protein [Arthrobacter sp. H35-D1]